MARRHQQLKDLGCRKIGATVGAMRGL